MEKPPNESQTVFYRLTEIHLGIRQVLSKVLFPVIIMTDSGARQTDSSKFDELVDELQAMISQRNKELHDERVASQKLQAMISQWDKELDDERSSIQSPRRFGEAPKSTC